MSKFRRLCDEELDRLSPALDRYLKALKASVGVSEPKLSDAPPRKISTLMRRLQSDLGAGLPSDFDGTPDDVRKLREISAKFEWFGNSGVPGFSERSEDYAPKTFEISRYSIDTMVPLINLHAYDQFFPTCWVVRNLSLIQHVLGWWWFTVFLASFAIL